MASTTMTTSTNDGTTAFTTTTTSPVMPKSSSSTTTTTATVVAGEERLPTVTSQAEALVATALRDMEASGSITPTASATPTTNATAVPLVISKSVATAVTATRTTPAPPPATTIGPPCATHQHPPQQASEANQHHHQDKSSSAATTTTTKKPKKSSTLLPVRERDVPLKYDRAVRKQQFLTSLSNGGGKPCLAHTPTLQQLKSITFADYIQKVVLASAEVLYDSDEDSSSSDDDDDDDDFNAEHWHDRDPMPLAEGMAKVTLPTGFWATEQDSWTAGDRTGRGPAWQSGTPLGDYVISTPITQHVRGLAGVYEYSFMDQPSMTLSQFRTKADAYRQDLVGCPYDIFVKEAPQSPHDLTLADVAHSHDKATQDGTSKEQEEEKDDLSSSPVHKASNKSKNVFANEEERLAYLERYFWKRLGPTMPAAWYGADHEGTLFPDNDDASGWSVGQLDSCLHVLPHVPGVTTPYLYLGMWASVFCAHTEDMNLLSINYLHAGAPKLWYAIAPGPDSKRFESLCTSCFVGTPSTMDCPEFLRHKRSLLSPKVLQKAGIKYTTAIQRPGDAIITFPAGYHFGFNTGFNIAEATNFGVPEWIPYGLQARVCLCRPDSVRIDMNRLARYLAEFNRDQSRYRRKRLSWKEWSAKKHGKNDDDSDKPKQVAVGGSTSPQQDKADRAAMSEQEKRGEFWIEVAKPIAKKAKQTKRKGPLKEDKESEENETEESVGRGRRKRKLTAKAAWLEREQQRRKTAVGGSPPETESKRPSAATSTIVEEIWHLAKPLPKKLVKVGVQVLVLLAGTSMGHSHCHRNHEEGSTLDDEDNSDDYYLYSAKAHNGSSHGNRHKNVTDDEDDGEELCFVGDIAKVSGDYLRIHIDGLPHTEDVWMNVNDDKVFLNGGRWDEDSGEEGDCTKTLPQLHYWEQMDSKHRCG